MPIEYYRPERDELSAAIRKEFAFLQNDYGYVELTERPERYVDPYSVLYRRPPLEVLVEGISYGFEVAVEFRVRADITHPPDDQFSLWWITQLRRPDLQEPQFPDKRGQLIQLPRLANELRTVADDLLRGDLSIMPEVRSAIAKARAEGEQSEKRRQFQMLETRSTKAFRIGDYARVIAELEPHRDLLNPSSRKRLEIAKLRAGPTG